MTILRSGPSKKFSSNWASAFGKKKPKKTATKSKAKKSASASKKRAKKK